MRRDPAWRDPVCPKCGGMSWPDVGCYRCRAWEAEARAGQAEAELKHVSHLAAKCRDALHRAEAERDELRAFLCLALGEIRGKPGWTLTGNTFRELCWRHNIDPEVL
jgi:hypothetical protein